MAPVTPWPPGPFFEPPQICAFPIAIYEYARWRRKCGTVLDGEGALTAAGLN